MTLKDDLIDVGPVRTPLCVALMHNMFSFTLLKAAREQLLSGDVRLLSLTFHKVEHALRIAVPDRQAISGQLEPASGLQGLKVTLFLLPEAFLLTSHQGAGNLAKGKPIALHLIMGAIGVTAP